MATATSSMTWQPMNLWRLEWLRLKRTPRALTMAAVFVFFGLLQPILTKYQSQLLSHVGNGVRISFPPATPAAGVSGYFGELAGTGLIVLVVIAAGAFTTQQGPASSTMAGPAPHASPAMGDATMDHTATGTSGMRLRMHGKVAMT